MKEGHIITVGELEYIWLNGHYHPNQPYMLSFIGQQIEAEEENEKRKKPASS